MVINKVRLLVLLFQAAVLLENRFKNFRLGMTIIFNIDACYWSYIVVFGSCDFVGD